MDIFTYWGIPVAITGLIFGIFLFIIKKDMNKRDSEREEREKNTERLMLLTLQNTRAINVLATATAKAVQRIPDANCNGDMKAALEQAAKIQKEEKDFLFDQGIKHIFGD